MQIAREIGQFIDAERRSLAIAIVDRQYERQPHLRERYGEAGRGKCVQDTEYHLSYLAAALTYWSPTLFAEYLRWAKGVMVAYGVDIADVEMNLECMREVLRERIAAEGLQRLETCLDLATESLRADDSPVDSFLTPDRPLAALASEYLRALLAADRNRAITLVMQEVAKGTPLRDIYLHVFQSCQHEVGRLWHKRQITVAQEHYCTAATQLAMSQLYPHLCAQERNGKRLVSISVNGELHELGLRVVNDLFEADGWDTVYLGANVPPESAVKAIEEHRPHIILISATMTFHVPAVERLIRQIRASEAAASSRILVGGYPFNLDPDLWRRVGADAHGRDADEAIAAANRLLERREGAISAEYALASLAAMPAEIDAPPPDSDRAAFDDLSRLNNELLTTQRALAKKNAELETLHRKLIEADRRKDDFLATLAHELRNPLAPIRTGLELMRLASEDKTLMESVRRMMEDQTSHLVRLVDDLLDVSRVVNGKVILRKATVELYPLVQNAIDAARSTIDEHGHELVVTLPTDPILLDADATRVTQIFTNLLTNAARYTSDGGRIEFAARAKGSEVEISVSDTGIGIPADMLERIFDMFTQVDRPAERNEGGLGIGLMLVKRLSELHGGSVRAFSDGPGKGSKFTVLLPRVRKKIAPVPEAERLVAVPKKLKILVADDMTDAAVTLAAMLKTLGNELQTANDGLEAVQLAEEFQPDVVLMDLSMPKVNGLEAARRIRKAPWGKRIKLIALTSWGQEADKQRTAAAGFDHHLVKPVAVAELQELLAQTGPRARAGKA